MVKNGTAELPVRKAHGGKRKMAHKKTGSGEPLLPRGAGVCSDQIEEEGRGNDELVTYRGKAVTVAEYLELTLSEPNDRVSDETVPNKPHNPYVPRGTPGPQPFTLPDQKDTKI